MGAQGAQNVITWAKEADTPVLQNQELVGQTDGTRPVRDQYHGAASLLQAQHRTAQGRLTGVIGAVPVVPR